CESALRESECEKRSRQAASDDSHASALHGRALFSPLPTHGATLERIMSSEVSSTKLRVTGATSPARMPAIHSSAFAPISASKAWSNFAGERLVPRQDRYERRNEARSFAG